MTPDQRLDPITILVPCKDQKPAFFEDALRSLIRQTSPDWRAIVIFARDTPDALHEIVRSFSDQRLRVLTRPRDGFAAGLNFGLQQSETTFVSILLSDDRLAPEAVETVQAYRRRYPQADFFHSSRRWIGSDGSPVSDVSLSRAATLDQFSTRGSPVKHWLCWRRSLAIEIGGFDEELSAHGCDDYDFPWSMAEAGCRFRNVSECLYDVRQHTDFARLTTGVSIAQQIDGLRRMFAKHHVSDAAYCKFLQAAAEHYLIRDHDGDPVGTQIQWAAYTEAGPETKEAFLRQGFSEADFIPHRVYRLPKAAPPDETRSLRELRLYGASAGRAAPIGVATVAVDDDCLHLISDGWTPLLSNAAFDYALDLGSRTIYAPRAHFAPRYADSEPVNERWRIDVPANKDRCVRLSKNVERFLPQKMTAEDVTFARARWL